MRPGLGWLLGSVCDPSVGHLSLKLGAIGMQDARSTGRPLLAALLTAWFALGIGLHHLPAL
jgi:hypothetical protein